MAKYTSGRQKDLKVGLSSYSENLTSLEVVGKVGIGTTNATSSLYVVGDEYVTGVITATTFYGSFSGNSSTATYATNAGIATQATRLQNSRTFEITGDIVASPISFDGTGNVSLAATIQPNSVALGTDTTGDYVQSISGTANQITVTGGTGESSTPVISIPSNSVLPGNVTIANDLQVNNNLNVTGNITIGGTSAYIIANDFRVQDPDIILGFTTNILGQDVSNDTTANHGGIAVASTEGNPLVNLNIAGIETLPATYKKIMWFKAGAFAGLGTDAWLSNYAIGIGSTQVPNGVRLAVGGVHVTDTTVTATTFSGNATSATSATTAGTATTTLHIPNLSGDITSADTVTTLATVNSNVGTYGDAGAIPRVTVNAKGLVTGVTTVAPNDGQLSLGVSGTGLSGSATFTANQSGSSTFTVTSNATNVNTPSTIVARDASGNFSAGTITANLTGTATTATNLSNAANITTGTINSARLSGSYSIDITGNAATAGYAITAGIATYATNAGIATYATNAGIATYATSSGIATYATNAGTSTSVVGGISSVTQLSVSGFSTVGVLTATSIGIGTANPTSKLWVNGDGYFVGVVSASNFYVGGNVIGGGAISGDSIVGTALSISGISTLGTVQISSGIITATSGVVTYYGDGRYLQNVVGFAVSLQSPVSNPVYPMFANNTGVTTAGISTTQLVFVPSSGNLGLGSTQPGSKLTVQGDVKVSGVVTATTFYGSASGLTDIPPSPGQINITDSSINASYYPTFTVGTGYTDILNTTSTKLSFNPSSGSLTTFGFVGAALSVSGISTFRNGPVLIGSATSTGTALQGLQVTGGAYVSGSVGIGTTNPQYIFTVSDTGTPATAGLTNCLADFTTTANSYGQINLRNTSTGTNASSDIIITADNGSDTTNFIDLGINNSGFSVGSWTINGANDGYLYTSDTNLSIGAASANKYVSFFTGGTLAANERVRITGIGSVGIGITNPQYPLQVQGNARITGAIYDSANSPGTTGQVLQSTVTGTQWAAAPPAPAPANIPGLKIFDTSIDNALYVQPTGTLDRVGVSTTVTQITTFPSGSNRYVIHSIHVTNISNGDAEITAAFDIDSGKVLSSYSSGGGAGIHTCIVSSASTITIGMGVTGTNVDYDTLVTDVSGTMIVLSKPLVGTPSGTLTFTPVSEVVSRLPVPVGSAVELLKQPFVLYASDSIRVQATGVGTGGQTASTTATASSGAAVLTVASATNIASGQLVGGTGIATNTYVGVGYTPASTSVPITRATTAALSSGSVTFTDLIVPQDGALHATIVYQATTDIAYLNGTSNGVGVGTTATVYYGTGNTFPSVIQSIRVANISDMYNNPGGDYPVWVGIGNSDTIFSWLAYNMVIPKNSSIELCEAPKRLGIGQSIFAYSDAPNKIEIQIAGKQKTT